MDSWITYLVLASVAIQNSENVCKPPKVPKHGFWRIPNNDDAIIHSDSLSEGTTVQIFCAENFYFKGDEFLQCKNGTWGSEVGSCLRKCPSISNTPEVTAKCTFQGRQLEDCVNPPEFTVVTFSCTDHNYGHHGSTAECLDGVWSEHAPPECKPVCGNKGTDIMPLILGGTEAKSVPWQVGIYSFSKKRQGFVNICSGTLLTPRMILTGAHCMANSTSPNLPIDQYRVTVGKYDTIYNSTANPDAQYASLKYIFIHERYRGNRYRYDADIAILVPEKPFKISALVQPACLSFEESDFSEGWVAGWGASTLNGTQDSETLMEVKIPLLNRTFCERTKTYELFDKFCGGDLQKGINTCRGDDGAGVLVKNKTDDKFYVVGIVFMSVEDCGLETYTYFTDVSIYKDFIIDAKNRIENECFEGCKGETKNFVDCVLPKYPRNGYWTVFGNATVFPGDNATSSTVINVFCHREYLLDAKDFLTCEDGKWSSAIGKCLAKCPPLFSTSKIEVKCKFNNIETENCTDVPSFTVATFKCKEYYQDYNLFKTGNRVCKDGVWLQELPDCRLVCGNRNGTNAQLLVYGGEETTIQNFPWQVAIYGKNKILSCGGSLISQNMVLTAAHCVTSSFDGAVFPAEDYEVAVGKYYREYRGTTEGSDVQYSNVKEIVIHDSYRGFLQHYVADIALMITEITFQLSLKVQPVCISSSPDIDKDLPATEGWVPGWGITDDGSLSEVLKVLKVPLLEQKHCASSASFTNNYLTHDKMCVGYFNQSKSVCKGDSGGGLVFRHRINGRYYLKGLVSLAPPSESGCSSENFGLFTNVSIYIQFIDEARSKIK